jgi:hypothetical protein
MTFIDRGTWMFTLPIDKIIEPWPAPLGKKVHIPTWNLKVSLVPGIMRHNTWTPVTDSSQWPNTDMCVQVWLGSQSLIDQKLTHSPINLSHDVEDQGPCYQELKIVLSGKSATKLDSDVMLHVDLAVENLSIMPVLDTHGQYVIHSTGERKIPGEYMGENGEMTLNIYTPIYVWLLQNQVAINQFYQMI